MTNSLKAMLRVAICAATVGGGTMVSAQTVTEAVRQAHENNPELESQFQDLEIARERVSEARAGRMPEVNLEAGYGYQVTDTTRPVILPPGIELITEQPVYNAELSAELPLYTGGSVSAGIRQAKAGRSAAELQYDAAVQSLTLNVVTAYLDVVTGREAIRIRQNSLNLLSQQLRAALDRFEVGVVTRTDVALAEARVEGGRAELLRTQAELEAANATYVFLVGDIPGDLVRPGTPPPVPTSFDDALTIALSENPDLQALVFADRSAADGVDVARGPLRPSLALVGTATVQETLDDNFEDTAVTALVTGSVPLFERGVARSQLRQSKLLRQQARLDLDNARRQVRASVATAWFGRLAAESAITASQRQVAAAEIAYEGALEELSVGNRTTLEVLDQEQELLDSRLTLLEAERDFYVATFELLAATGGLSADVR